MRRLIYGIMMLLLFARCADFIDVVPENSTTFTSFFQTEKDAEALLNSLKSQERKMVLNQIYEPHVSAGLLVDSTQDLEINQAKGLDINVYTRVNWKEYYRTINYADVILDNLHRFPLSDEILDIYALQAYFSKGLAYYYLAQRWGECPITKGSLYMDKIAKSPVGDVLEEATKWALKAMDLPTWENLKDSDGKQRGTKQYASKGAAAALLALIYSWRAEIEGKPEFWAEAEKYCSMIINGEVGNYSLAKDPEEVCTGVLLRGHAESIWEIYKTKTEMLTPEAYFQAQFVEFPVKKNSQMNPSKWPMYAVRKTTVNTMYDKEDLRRNAYFTWLDADSIFMYSQGKELVADTMRPKEGSYDNDLENGDIGLLTFDNDDIEFAYVNVFRNAFYELDSWSGKLNYRGMDMDKIVWRLADILLLRAECRARQNLPNAADDLNAIRERAYGNRMHDYDPARDGDLQYAIFHEREKELFFEFDRFYALRRNGLDYVRKISPQFEALTETDIKNGALYYGVPDDAFTANDLMRQNVYWNEFLQ